MEKPNQQTTFNTSKQSFVTDADNAISQELTESLIIKLTDNLKTVVNIDTSVRLMIDSNYTNSNAYLIPIPIKANNEVVYQNIANLLYDSLVAYQINANPQTSHYGFSLQTLCGNQTSLLSRETEKLINLAKIRNDIAGKVVKNVNITDVPLKQVSVSNVLQEVVKEGLDIHIGLDISVQSPSNNYSRIFIPLKTDGLITETIYRNLESMILQNLVTYDENHDQSLSLSVSFIFKELETILSRSRTKLNTRRKLLANLKANAVYQGSAIDRSLFDLNFPGDAASAHETRVKETDLAGNDIGLVPDSKKRMQADQSMTSYGSFLENLKNISQNQKGSSMAKNSHEANNAIIYGDPSQDLDRQKDNLNISKSARQDNHILTSEQIGNQKASYNLESEPYFKNNLNGKPDLVNKREIEDSLFTQSEVIGKKVPIKDSDSDSTSGLLEKVHSNDEQKNISKPEGKDLIKDQNASRPKSSDSEGPILSSDLKDRKSSIITDSEKPNPEEKANYIVNDLKNESTDTSTDYDKNEKSGFQDISKDASTSAAKSVADSDSFSLRSNKQDDTSKSTVGKRKTFPENKPTDFSDRTANKKKQDSLNNRDNKSGVGSLGTIESRTGKTGKSLNISGSDRNYAEHPLASIREDSSTGSLQSGTRNFSSKPDSATYERKDLADEIYGTDLQESITPIKKSASNIENNFRLQNQIQQNKENQKELDSQRHIDDRRNASAFLDSMGKELSKDQQKSAEKNSSINSDFINPLNDINKRYPDQDRESRAEISENDINKSSEYSKKISEILGSEDKSRLKKLKKVGRDFQFYFGMGNFILPDVKANDPSGPRNRPDKLIIIGKNNHCGGDEFCAGKRILGSHCNALRSTTGYRGMDLTCVVTMIKIQLDALNEFLGIDKQSNKRVSMRVEDTEEVIETIRKDVLRRTKNKEKAYSREGIFHFVSNLLIESLYANKQVSKYFYGLTVDIAETKSFQDLDPNIIKKLKKVLNDSYKALIRAEKDRQIVPSRSL